VLTLALGIGANTAIFSVVDGVLLRPAPFTDSERLVVVWETDRVTGTVREPASVPDYLDFRTRATAFEQLAAFSGTEVNLTPAGSDPVRLAALAVSAEFLPLVGVEPLLGRVFLPEEDRPGSPTAVLIGEDLWTRLFNRDPNVVGQALRLDDRPVTVVGVLRAESDFGTLQILGAAAYGRAFADRGAPVEVDVWVPLRADPLTTPRSTHPIFVLGRLARGATAQAAQQEMTAVMAELERSYPENAGRGALVEPLDAVVFGPVRPALLVLFGSVALVLLVACVNVANLMLARGEARLHDVTVRTALGAGMRRLVRQFAAEGLVLTAAGAGLGLLLAVVGLELLVSLAPANIPRIGAVAIDGRVLAATLGACLLVALFFGLLPSFQAGRVGLQQALQSGAGRSGSAGPGRNRFRSALVVTELALAVVLMIGAGLLIRTLWELQRVDPGFRTAGIVKAEYQLPPSRYPMDGARWPDWPEVNRFNAELRRQLGALPGVRQVAIAAEHPVSQGFQNSFLIVGREAEAAELPEISVRRVSAGYFETLGSRLVAGRAVEERDRWDQPPVLLINETARRMFFAGREPLGQRIRLWGTDRSIVGVVAGERIHGLASEAPPAVYLPLEQVPSFGGGYTVLVDVAGDPANVTPSLRAVFRTLDPALAVFGIEPLDRTLAQTFGKQRFTMLVLSIFAAVALVLAAIGVHGVLSYTIARRRRDLGIRMALGADPRRVRRHVLGQGVLLAGAGVAPGLLGGLALSRTLSGLLYGVSASDPLTFGGVAITLGAVGLLASFLPAYRAGRMEPVDALRTE
jgi:putative ABC transport system permease protein